MPRTKIVSPARNQIETMRLDQPTTPISPRIARMITRTPPKTERADISTPALTVKRKGLSEHVRKISRARCTRCLREYVECPLARQWVISTAALLNPTHRTKPGYQRIRSCNELTAS